jgi:hypothetical protein
VVPLLMHVNRRKAAGWDSRGNHWYKSLRG